MDVDVSLNYGATLVAALLTGTGFVLQQHAAEHEPESRFLSMRLIVDLLHKPRWLAGIGCMVAGLVLAAWSIGHLELSVVEPLLATNLLFALVLAVPLSRQRVRLTEVLGAAVLCTGVGLLAATQSAKPIGLSFGSVSHWYAAAVIAGIAFICVHAGRSRSGRWRAALTGLGAGLVFGIQDALTRQTLEILQGHSLAVLFYSWSAYALVGAGAVGLWLMQSAFSVGPLQFSLPAISACEPLAGIALGILVFGDRIQISPGILATQASGLAALVVGVILVARAPALSGLSVKARHGAVSGLSATARITREGGHRLAHPVADGVHGRQGAGLRGASGASGAFGASGAARSSASDGLPGNGAAIARAQAASDAEATAAGDAVVTATGAVRPAPEAAPAADGSGSGLDGGGPGPLPDGAVGELTAEGGDGQGDGQAHGSGDAQRDGPASDALGRPADGASRPGGIIFPGTGQP